MLDEKNPNWGGKRIGSGRKALDRKQVNFRVTNEEATLLRGILKQIRNPKNLIDWGALVEIPNAQIVVFKNKAVPKQKNKKESAVKNKIKPIVQVDPVAKELQAYAKQLSEELHRSVTFTFGPTMSVVLIDVAGKDCSITISGLETFQAKQKIKHAIDKVLLFET